MKVTEPTLDPFPYLWRPVLKTICSLSGRSNFDLARLAVIIGLGLQLRVFISIPFDPLAWWVFLSLPALALDCCRRLEKMAGDGGEMAMPKLLAFEISALHLLRFLSMIGVIVNLVLLFSPFWDYALGLTLMTAGCYFVTDFRPRGPSALVKILSGAWSKLSSLVLPGLSPQPA